MAYDSNIHPELAEDLAVAALPPIPTELRRGMSRFEVELYYIGLKDEAKRRQMAERPNAGVSWSGMSAPMDYTPKTHAQMVAEARAKVGA